MAAQYPGLRRRHQAGGGGANNPLGGDANFDGGGGVGGGVDGDDINQLQQVQQQLRQQLLRDPAPAGAGNRLQGQRVRRVLDQQQQQRGAGGAGQQWQHQQQQRRRVHPQLRTSHLYCLASALVALLAVVTAPGGGGSGGGQHNTKVTTAGLEGHDKGGGSSSLLMSSAKESGDFGGTGMDDLSSVENVAKAAVAGVAAVSTAKTPTAPPPPLPSQPSHHGRQKQHPKQQQQQEDNNHAKVNADAAMEDDEADFALFYSWSDLKDLLYGVAPTPALGNAKGDEADDNNNKEEQKQQATSERRDKRTRQSDLQQHAIKHQQRNNAAKEHQQHQQQQGDSDGQTSSGTESATPAAGPPAFFRFMNPFLISKTSSHQEATSNDKESSSEDAAAASSTNDDQSSSTSSSPAADPNSHYYTHKSIARPFLHFVTNLIDPALRTPNTGSPTDVIDKILTSTPRILAIANLLLAMTYLLHSAVADMFLGHGNGGGAGGAAAAGMAGMAGPTTPGGGNAAAAAGMPPGMGLNNNNNNPIIMADQDSRTHRRVGRERLGGFLVFKLLLISAVVLPDTLDLLILLSWYTLLAFLRSLAHLAHTTTAHTSQSGQPPRPGVLRLLFVVLLCDFTAAASCVALFHGAGWGMVLLLTCDCALLAVDVLCHIARHVGQALEERHGRRVSEMEDLQLRLHARNRRRQQQEQEQQQQEEEAEENPTEEEEENLVGNEQGADGEGVEIQLVNEATNDLGQVVNPGAVEHNEQTDTHVVVQENVGSNSNINNRDRHSNDDEDEIQHDPQQDNNNESNEQQEQPQPQQENVETESRSLDRQMEVLETLHSRRLSILDTTVFLLELFAYGLTVCHFLHIWSLHGLQFTLIDGVLALHLHSAVSAAGKKIAERRNLNRIARDLDGFFDDATELEMRKASAAGDVCCICLGTMSAGNVKKVGCGHLYHTHCLREVVERARSIEAAKCPLCRANVVDGTHHPVQPSNNNNNNNNNNGAGIRNLGVNVNMDGNAENNGDNINNNNNEQQGQQQQQQPPQQQQQQQGMNVDGQPQPQQQQQQMNQGEHALFRFSTEGILPAWLPLPAFSFEVVRRPPVAVDPPPPAANVNDNNNANNNANNNNGQQPQPQVGDVGNNNGNNNQQGQGQQQQQQGDQNGASFWRRLLVLAGAIPMSPEEEARAVDQLVDMFPQYDRADLLRELRDRGSAEAVVEAVLVGAFSGVARGGGGGGGVGGGGAGLAPAMGGNNNNNGLGGIGMMGNAALAPVEANDGGNHIFVPFEEAGILADLTGVENIANDDANDNDSSGADAQNVEDVDMMLGTDDIVNGEAAGTGVQRQNATTAPQEDRVDATHGVQDQNTNEGRTASTT